MKKQQTVDKPVERQSQVDPFESLEERPSSPGRHWSISNLKSKFAIKKSASFNVTLRDDSTIARRRDRSITSSTFYENDNMAVTKNMSEPAEFTPLELRGKNMNELLKLLKPVS